MEENVTKSTVAVTETAEYEKTRKAYARAMARVKRMFGEEVKNMTPDELERYLEVAMETQKKWDEAKEERAAKPKYDSAKRREAYLTVKPDAKVMPRMTKDEITRIVAMCDQDCSMAAIAVALNRSLPTIKKYIAKYAPTYKFHGPGATRLHGKKRKDVYPKKDLKLRDLIGEAGQEELKSL